MESVIVTRFNCIIDGTIYALNKNNTIISFDTTKMLQEVDSYVLSKMEFVPDKYCKNALKSYISGDNDKEEVTMRSLHKDKYLNVISSYGKNIILMNSIISEQFPSVQKLWFVNVKNGNVESIDVDVSHFVSQVYDFGIFNRKYLYICDFIQMDIYKVHEIEKNKVVLDLIIGKVDLRGCSALTLKERFRASTAIKNSVYFWLIGYQYIKFTLQSEVSYEVDAGRIHLNGRGPHTYMQGKGIVEASKMDDKHIVMYFSKGGIGLFNIDKEKVVIMTEVVPDYANKWYKKLNKQKWKMVSGLISAPNSSKLCYGYVRRNYEYSIADVLIHLMIKYYERYQGSVILFTGSMESVEGFKFKNMDIIDAGIYQLDGEYNQIKGSKFNYSAPRTDQLNSSDFRKQ